VRWRALSLTAVSTPARSPRSKEAILPLDSQHGIYRERLRLDPQCQSMLNAKNMSGQQGTLVLEPVCSNPVSQRDTIEEGVCDSFHQNIYQPNMLP